MSNRGNLAKLLMENPDLPVLCMVEYEIVAGDECTRWAASLGEAKIREYIYYDEFMGGPVIYWREDAEELVDRMVEDVEQSRYEEARQKAWEKVNAMPWIKAIVVNIDLPEV